MPDYISRAAANEACREAVRRYPNSFYNGIEAARDAIRKLPAADVRPVVRGEYIGEADGYADGELVYDMWSCSVCGCRYEDWDEKPTYNFCPNCGADMRGEQDV